MQTMNTRNNIGIDARLWNETGVGRYIRNLVCELQAIDQDIAYTLFILEKDKEEVTSYITNPRFKIRTTDIVWHTLNEQWNFPKIIEKEHIDLMHFPYFSMPIFYKGPYILTIHDVILHNFPTGKASTRSWFIYQLKHLGYLYVMSQAVRKSLKIITVSHATKHEIVKHLRVPIEKITVIYEGVDKNISNKDINYSLPTANYFLYVGNAYPHKNLQRLLEAFASLKAQEKYSLRGTPAKFRSKEIKTLDTRLIFIGKRDFFYKRLEEKVKEMGLGNSIVFKHNVTDEELAKYYSNALALIAPVYFDPLDTNSLENVLESIAKGEIEDEEERKSKGKERAKQFSWKEMAQKTQEVYTGCLSLRQGK